MLDRVRIGELSDRQRTRPDRAEIESQLGWLEAYQQALNVWTSLCEVAQASCTVVRRYGYTSATVVHLRAALGTGAEYVTQGTIDEITTLVERQCNRITGQYDRLLVSSEAIESLIGKAKRLLGTSENNNSLADQILSLAANFALGHEVNSLLTPCG